LSAKGKENKKRKAAWAGEGKDWWAAGPPGQKGKKVCFVFFLFQNYSNSNFSFQNQTKNSSNFFTKFYTLLNFT
jgi:hypothetical protein